MFRVTGFRCSPKIVQDKPAIQGTRVLENSYTGVRCSACNRLPGRRIHVVAAIALTLSAGYLQWRR